MSVSSCVAPYGSIISFGFQEINYYMNSPFLGLVCITLMSSVVYHFDGTLEKCECAAAV